MAVFTREVHVIVVGCGRVGSGLATSLVAEGHDVVIIDRQAKAFVRLGENFTGTTLLGSGFDRDDLIRAGAEKADALAAVTSGDNTNILTARIARETFGIDRVVARIYDPRRAEIYQRLGIPTVATVTWTVDQVRHHLLPEISVREWADLTGEIMLIDRILPESWAGRRLGDLEVPERIRLVAVSRAGKPRLDCQDLVGQEGDRLHVALHTSALDEFNTRCEAKTVTGAKP